jgi:hypothetical protein
MTVLLSVLLQAYQTRWPGASPVPVGNIAGMCTDAMGPVQVMASARLIPLIAMTAPLWYKGVKLERRYRIMELNLDDQKLLADFHRLSAEGQKELLDYGTFLVKKYAGCSTPSTDRPANQCAMGKKVEERPEAVKEPIFTE